MQVLVYITNCVLTKFHSSDDPLLGPTEELDLGSEDDKEPQLAIKGKKSKQFTKPPKIIPRGSDHSDDESDASEDEDEDGPTTMANMEARSRALDAKAAVEAELDMEELQDAAPEDDDEFGDGVDMDGPEDEHGEMNGEPFALPTAREREEEKLAGGPDVHLVQRRMRECVKVLGKFRKLAAKGR